MTFIHVINMTLTAFESYIKMNHSFGQQKKLKHENNRVK
jgi:hypothetical protein